MIDAPDRATAVRLLRQRGITPTALQELSSAKAASNGAARAATNGAANTRPPAAPAQQVGSVRKHRSAMSRVEFASFIREVATALQAGLPIVQALRTIERQVHSAKQRAMLTHILHEVEHGRSLADAAQSWGPPFDELTVGLIRAGEASGRLDTVLDQGAVLLDRDVKVRRAVLSGLMYPAIIGALIVVAIVVIVTFIVPNILNSVQGQIGGVEGGAALPLPTRIVAGTADFFAAYWWLIGLALGGAFIGWRSARRDPQTRRKIDRFALRVPVLGRLLRDVAVARFTRTMGTLTSAGLPVVTALRSTRATLGNRELEAVIDHVCDEVSAGRTIAEPMDQSGQFPPMLVQIISVGERSGRLPQMLTRAASVFEDRTETSVKAFTTILPPLLVIIAAVMVGFIMLSILLPLLQLADAVQAV